MANKQYTEGVGQAQASGNPIKTYHVVNQHTFSSRHLEIQHNGQVIFWANEHNQLFHNTIVNLSVEAEHGPVVAACKLESFSQGVRFHLGNPDRSDKSAWAACDCTGFAEKHWSFRVDGRLYTWKRTHNRDLGGKTFGIKTFKLVDEGGNVVLVYVFTKSLGKLSQIATVDFYVEPGQQVERASLVTMLGIQVGIRRRN